MTAIERTAYPRFKESNYRKHDLQLFLPTDEECELMQTHDIRSDKMRLSFIIQLKTFQYLGYFPKLDTVPNVIIKQTRQRLCSPKGMKPGYKHADSKYRHRDLIRSYLQIDENNKARDELIIQVTHETAKTMNDPANIINVVIETLIKQRYELPAFATLDKTVCGIRHKINEDIFKTIRQRLTKAKKITILTDTLVKKDNENKTPYNCFKRLPGKPTVTHFKELVEHHNWLMEFGDFTTYLDGISKIKLEQFAQEARSLDATILKAMRNENKKLSLIACLLAQSQCRTKDALALTFCRCVHDSEKAAERHHEALARNKDETAKSIAEFLLEMTSEFVSKHEKKKEALIKLFVMNYHQYGGTDHVIQDCEKVLAKGKNKHLPFIWKYYQSKRTGVFSFLKSINLESVKQDKPLMQAIKQVEQNRKNKKNPEWLELNKKIDLSFAPKDWVPLIAKKDRKTINTRYFEICVMMQLREKLSSSDIYIKGADAYGDYRQTLLPWNECIPLLGKFCEASGIPRTAKELISWFKNRLRTKAKEVDEAYPSLKELVIDELGEPKLKKRPTKKNPQARILRNEIKKRMPERNLLDIMCLAQNCTEWACCFSLLSGSNSKLVDPIGASVVTAFGYGTGMGPSETARHVRADFSRKTIASVNKNQVTLKKLNLALARIVDYYKDFPLVKAWGTGKTVIVDGTLRKIYSQNLLAEAHFRYQAKGGIAYHHISDSATRGCKEGLSSLLNV